MLHVFGAKYFVNDILSIKKENSFINIWYEMTVLGFT